MAKQKPKDELTTEMYHEFLEDAGVDAGTKMETIFDHGVTEKEVIALCGLKKNRQQNSVRKQNLSNPNGNRKEIRSLKKKKKHWNEPLHKPDGL